MYSLPWKPVMSAGKPRSPTRISRHVSPCMLYSLSQTLSAIKAPIESQEVIRRASKRSKRQVTGADDRRGTKRNTTMNEFFSFFLTIATTHQPQEGRNSRQEAFEVDRKWKNKTFRQLKWAFWNIKLLNKGKHIIRTPNIQIWNKQLRLQRKCN